MTSTQAQALADALAEITAELRLTRILLQVAADRLVPCEPPQGLGTEGSDTLPNVLRDGLPIKMYPEQPGLGRGDAGPKRKRGRK